MLLLIGGCAIAAQLYDEARAQEEQYKGARVLDRKERASGIDPACVTLDDVWPLVRAQEEIV
jgi:hypothetical protein